MKNIDLEHLYRIYKDEVKNPNCSNIIEFRDEIEAKIEEMIREDEFI